MLAAACALWIGWALGVHEARGSGELAEAGAALARVVLRTTPAEWAAEWLRRAGALALLAALAAGALAAGRAATAFARRPRASWTLALPLGWTLLGAALFAAALDGLAFPAVLAAIVLAPLAAFPGALPVRALRRPPGLPRERSARAGALACGAALLLAALAALPPEDETDPLIYHYGIPARILLLHRYAPCPENIPAHFPPLWEALLLPLLAFGGEGATRAFAPALLGLLVLGAFRLARPGLGARGAWCAAALTASSPFLAGHVASAKNDLLAAVLGLAAFAWLAPSRGASGSALAGVLAGGAFAVKYSGGYALPACAAAVLAGASRSGAARGARLLALAAGFAAAAAPFLAQSWLRTGDPVFPAGARWLGGHQVSVASLQRFDEMIYSVTRQDPGDVSKRRNLEGLWPPDGRPQTHLRWAALLPLALLSAAPWGAPARAGWAALAALAACWFLGPPAVRYGAVMFPLGAWLAAAALARVPPGPAAPLRRVLPPVLVALQLVHVAAGAADRLPAALGLERANAYRARTLSTYEAFVAETNRLAPPPARLVAVGEAREARFAARTDLSLTGAAALPFTPLVRSSRDAAGVWKRVRQRGWTHVVYNRLTAFFWRRTAADDRWTEAELTRWAAFWERHAEPAAESPVTSLAQGHFYLFRLVPRARAPGRAVLPGVEGWVYRLEQAAGDERTLASGWAALRRAAGGYGVVDAAEAEMFRDRMNPAAREVLLRRAAARGWRSALTSAERAGYALAAGRSAEAERLLAEARALDPERTDAELLRMAGRAAAAGRAYNEGGR